MAQTMAQKLRIKEGITLLTINAPADFASHLGDLPAGMTISAKAKDYQQIHWFVKDKQQVEKEVEKVLTLLRPDIICWIYYPKGTSKIQTDLTRDKGWDSLLKHKELQWLVLVSFDDIWSAFSMRLQSDSDKKKEVKPAAERPIFDYIDAATKTVRLPEDLEKALKSSKKAADFFESITFTNKKEYVEWVVTAKREETRKERITGTIERLEKGWKNPRNL